VSLAPDHEVPRVVEAMPASFAGAENSDAYRPQSWWFVFEDPVLNLLVNRVLAGNLNIAESAARVEQANAQAQLAQAPGRPSVDVNANAGFSSTPLAGTAFGDLAAGAIDRIENENYSVSLGAAYELDFFGRVRNDASAASSDALASQYDFQTVRLASVAEGISAYFDVVDTRHQIALTRKTISVLEDLESTLESRFGGGLVASSEIYQIRQDLRLAQTSLARLESTLAASTARLALVIGQYPDEVDKLLLQPLTPRLTLSSVPVGLPADLLAQRPDVAAAWARLDSARLRIGARRADRFPRLSLSAMFGTQGGRPDSVFDFADNWASSLAAGIVAPLLDGGRVFAGIRSARAVYDREAATYARTVLDAYHEVDSSIVDYEKQRKAYSLKVNELGQAWALVSLEKSRYESGIGSYQAHLTSLLSYYRVESSLSSAARSTALARLGVHRALGGDWVSASDAENLVAETGEQVPTETNPEGEKP